MAEEEQDSYQVSPSTILVKKAVEALTRGIPYSKVVSDLASEASRLGVDSEEYGNCMLDAEHEVEKQKKN